MAASYITWTLAEKITELKRLERQPSGLGPIKTAQTAPGVRTEFDTKDINLSREREKLIAAIIADAEFTSDHELYDAIMGAQRAGITVPEFY